MIYLLEMKRRSCLLTLFWFGWLFSPGILAQGPPIFTDTPIMLGLEGGGVRTFGNIINKENANAYTHILAVPYNITNRWQVGGVIPFVSISPEGMESRSGIGDIKFFTKYQIYQKDGKAKTLRGLIKLTETFPTGNSTEGFAVGTGAYQTTISLVNGYITTRYGLYTEFGYNITSAGLPDNFVYNLAFGYPTLPQQYPPRQLNLFLELNGNYVLNDIGNNLFITPGIQYIAGRRVLFESGIQLPLDQAAPENMGTKFVLRIGARVLIF